MKIRNYINKQQTIGTVCLLIMAVIWGWAFVFQKMALNARLSPASLMFSRFFVAACLMGAFAAKQIKANYRPGQWKIGLKLAVL